MAKKSRPNNNRPKPRVNNSRPAMVRPPIAAPERKAPVTYGKPYTLLENDQKGTFIYKGGQWRPHTVTIAECKQDCQVKELPQKINGMTRYEIHPPIVVGV
jgi:hypothetical protein